MRRIFPQHTLRLAHQPLKPSGVDPLRIEIEHVPGPSIAHRRLAVTRAEDLADPRHVHLHRVLSGLGRPLTPKLVDQPIRQHRLRSLNEQQR